MKIDSSGLGAEEEKPMVHNKDPIKACEET